jgi:predicted amino acid racemase
MVTEKDERNGAIPASTLVSTLVVDADRARCGARSTSVMSCLADDLHLNRGKVVNVELATRN